MKKSIISLLIILYMILSISGCKRKYEDGPFISLKSKCKRLVRGWHLQYFYIDGQDSTSAVYKSLGISNDRLVVNLNDASTGSCNDIGPTDVRFVSNIYNGQLEGNYYLSKDGEDLNMTIIDPKKYTNVTLTPVGPFFTGTEVKYNIRRLTSKDLWLDVNYNGKYCWMHFEH